MAKITIQVTLKKSELLYDIENKAWLTGRSREDGANASSVSKMQADDEAADRNQMTRCMMNAVATLRNHIAEWINDLNVNEVTDVLDTGSAFTIVLKLPMNYNTSVNKTIGFAMHQYVVNTALAEWYGMTAKDEAQNYYTLAAANLQQLKEATFKRLRPSKPVATVGLGAIHG